MVNPQLLQYVRTQRTAGVSKEDIVKALASGGWTAADAQEAFDALDGRPPTPPPAASPTPTPPVSRPPVTQRPIQPVGPSTQVDMARPHPASGMQPMGMRVQTTTPAAPAAARPRRNTSSYDDQPKGRSVWPWMLVFSIVFLILGIGVGAFAAVKYEWINSIVSTVAGVPPASDTSGDSMHAMQENPNTLLEVSPEPFGTSSTTNETASSTPSAATSTATSSAVE